MLSTLETGLGAHLSRHLNWVLYKCTDC